MDPTKSNSKNPKKLDVQSTFWIFGVGFGWLFNHPSNPKSRKKLTISNVQQFKKVSIKNK
jgi:hypothetical protein